MKIYRILYRSFFIYFILALIFLVVSSFFLDRYFIYSTNYVKFCQGLFYCTSYGVWEMLAKSFVFSFPPFLFIRENYLGYAVIILIISVFLSVMIELIKGETERQLSKMKKAFIVFEKYLFLNSLIIILFTLFIFGLYFFFLIFDYENIVETIFVFISKVLTLNSFFYTIVVYTGYDFGFINKLYLSFPIIDWLIRVGVFVCGQVAICFLIKNEKEIFIKIKEKFKFKLK